jgi:hypothetical protein
MRGMSTLIAPGALLAGAIAYGKDPASKIGEARARTVGLSEVAGTIQSTKVEREGGKLIYSFGAMRPNFSCVEEVHVDTLTGCDLSRRHEGATKEAAEAKFEKLEAKVHRK